MEVEKKDSSSLWDVHGNISWKAKGRASKLMRSEKKGKHGHLEGLRAHMGPFYIYPFLKGELKDTLMFPNVSMNIYLRTLITYMLAS